MRAIRYSSDDFPHPGLSDCLLAHVSGVGGSSLRNGLPCSLSGSAPGAFKLIIPSVARPPFLRLLHAYPVLSSFKGGFAVLSLAGG